MAYETLILEIEDHVALITLNRPEALNALNVQLMGELSDALTMKFWLKTNWSASPKRS